MIDPETTPLGESPEEENARLRSDNERLKRERDALTKALVGLRGKGACFCFEPVDRVYVGDRAKHAPFCVKATAALSLVGGEG